MLPATFNAVVGLVCIRGLTVTNVWSFETPDWTGKTTIAVKTYRILAAKQT